MTTKLSKTTTRMGDYLITVDGETISHFYSPQGFEPLDFTDRDSLNNGLELIDGKPYQFEEAGTLWVGFYNSNDRLFYDSRCFNESITDSKNCTNIQPLTVGVSK